MKNFSAKHRLHLLDLLLQAAEEARIDHLISKSVLLCLRCHSIESSRRRTHLRVEARYSCILVMLSNVLMSEYTATLLCMASTSFSMVEHILFQFHSQLCLCSLAAHHFEEEQLPLESHCRLEQGLR